MVAPMTQIGPYRVERLLGIGSFATVWLGYDEVLDAHVAIKVLAENWSHDLRVRERFLDEARLLWRLTDDRVMRVFTVGELPDGRPYFVMSWAEGGSLRDRLAAGPVEVRAALALLCEISAGVAVLHDHGIVHRDLTPGNVLFTAEPVRVLIADLGLAKALAAASGLTARAGTPGYMAPEQDDPLAIVDRRADVYGLGRLGVQLLGVPGSGRPDEPVRLRDGVPRRVADVLRTATAQRPGDRYPDAAAFRAALDRAVAAGTRAGPVALAVGRSVLGLASIAALAILASDSVSGRFTARPGVAVDASGQIAIEVPLGWRVDSGGWELRGPALVVSPDPQRWDDDPTVPGVFVGLSRDSAVEPADFVAQPQRTHTACVAAPLRTSRRDGVEWLIAVYRECPNGRAEIAEVVGRRPDADGLVYVQVIPPAGSAPEFVDTLLAGLRVRWT
jgi:tRNA A-37 threonylcarbamoyl transferase component Bud32